MLCIKYQPLQDQHVSRYLDNLPVKVMMEKCQLPDSLAPTCLKTKIVAGAESSRSFHLRLSKLLARSHRPHSHLHLPAPGSVKLNPIKFTPLTSPQIQNLPQTQIHRPSESDPSEPQAKRKKPSTKQSTLQPMYVQYVSLKLHPFSISSSPRYLIDNNSNNNLLIFLILEFHISLSPKCSSCL